MTIETARQYIEDNTGEIYADRRNPAALSLMLAAKWGYDHEVIAALDTYLRSRLFIHSEDERAIPKGEALNPFVNQMATAPKE